jgi:hypothetical protein
MKEFFKRLVGSLDNFTKEAFSARKLTAFVIVVCILVGHGIYYKHCFTKEDFALFDTILIIDYIAVAFFLGIITIQQVIEFKNGKKNESTNNHTSDNTGV